MVTYILHKHAENNLYNSAPQEDFEAVVDLENQKRGSTKPWDNPTCDALRNILRPKLHIACTKGAKGGFNEAPRTPLNPPLKIKFVELQPKLQS